MNYTPEIRLCLFCKRIETDGVTFKSEEHVFPESLGNKKIILPRGVVCYCCNNSFSTPEGKLIDFYLGLFGRFILTDRTKKGKSPTSTRLPQKGRITREKGTEDIHIKQAT